MRFENKVAIVTGSGGGVGQAYPEALAREGAGVVVADINAQAAQKLDFLLTVDPEYYQKFMSVNLDGQGSAAVTHRAPKDLVGMSLFLRSDEASWITGQIFNVDGGQVIRS